MCVLQPCANPTQPGVWWRDDRMWCLYSAAHQEQIRRSITQGLTQIDLGSIASTVHPSGARYLANLREMQQVAVSSQQRRPIMVIDPVPSAQLQNRTPTGQQALQQLPRPSITRMAQPQVHYRDHNGQLQPYGSGVAQALLREIANGTQNSLLVPDMPSGNYYYFDLFTMSQYVVAYFDDGGQPVLSEKDPVTVVIEMPWNPTAMASLVTTADASMRRKVLVMVVERWKSDEHLDAILPSKAYPKTILSRNTYTLSAPGHPLYEKFVDSVDAAFSRCDKGVLGTFIKQMQSVGRGAGGPLQMVFKPVEPASGRVGSSSGFLPSPGSPNVGEPKAAFWTSMMAPVAAASAVIQDFATRMKIMVFLVILPHGDLSYEKQYVCSGPQQARTCSSYVQVDKPEHRLQLAEVTVS